MPSIEGEVAVTNFTASMLTQTFDGLMQALITQRERNAEFLRESVLTAEVFAAAYVTPEMARAELEARFGSTQDGACPADAGQPYTPPDADIVEAPPVFNTCGIQLGVGDYIRRKPIDKPVDGKLAAVYIITEQGAQRIVDAVVVKFADESLKKLRMIVRSGLPEVIVDSGRILTKASFRVDSGTQNSYGTDQVLVRILNMSGPEGFKSRIGMSGEMEVKFSVVRSESSGE